MSALSNARPRVRCNATLAGGRLVGLVTRSLGNFSLVLKAPTAKGAVDERLVEKGDALLSICHSDRDVEDTFLGNVKKRLGNVMKRGTQVRTA